MHFGGSSQHERAASAELASIDTANISSELRPGGFAWRRAEVAPWHAKLLSQLAAAAMAGGDASAALAHMDAAVEVGRSTGADQLVSLVC